MSRAIVHVHQAEMRKGNPALIIRTYKGSTHHKEITFNGPVKLVQSDTPDSCGARVWLICDSEDIEVVA